MQVSHVSIKNFRGIKEASIHLSKHCVLIGDNNTGKTTVIEAIDLVLGPDRLHRTPVIDEHDFYLGNYCHDDGAGNYPKVEIVVTVTDLTEEQKARFGNYPEFWSINKKQLIDKLPEVDQDSIVEALRFAFIGEYDPEEDDFRGKTYFARDLNENPTSPKEFTKKDKQFFGFLYLRSIRTGNRALSLERGSLLDIILRLKEIRPKMWEDTIINLASHEVASNPDIGISGILENLNTAIKKYVPKEWGAKPQLRVSNLTREHLRKIITAFIATEKTNYIAPFYRQGTGTINILVLALLSLIAENRQNVIFAMEEPETAIPPYTQKQIIHELKKLATQAIFTSHSPYVLEEFLTEDTIVLNRNDNGQLNQYSIALPKGVKPQRYRREFRTRFCEGLLARRILLAEGATEASAIPAVCRRLSELNSEVYSSLEELGICIVDAGSDSIILGLSDLYKNIGKQVFAICDKQDDIQKNQIENAVNRLFMHQYKGFENLIIENTTEEALKRFFKEIDWPAKLLSKYPSPENNIKNAMSDYFREKKGDGAVADFLLQCDENEIPEWLRETCISLKKQCKEVVIEKSISEHDDLDDTTSKANGALGNDSF